MKVRISANSIRFRLKQSEVKAFYQTGKIAEVTAFGFEPADTLTFLMRTTSEDRFAIHFKANTIIAQVPKTLANEWAQTNLVGFEESVETQKGQVIKLLVEKDFECLDGSGKENEDTYPNPNAFC